MSTKKQRLVRLVSVSLILFAAVLALRPKRAPCLDLINELPSRQEAGAGGVFVRRYVEIAAKLQEYPPEQVAEAMNTAANTAKVKDLHLFGQWQKYEVLNQLMFDDGPIDSNSYPAYFEKGILLVWGTPNFGPRIDEIAEFKRLSATTKMRDLGSLIKNLSR